MASLLIAFIAGMAVFAYADFRWPILTATIEATGASALALLWGLITRGVTWLWRLIFPAKKSAQK